MNNEDWCAEKYEEAKRHFRELYLKVITLENGNAMKMAGHDSGEPVTDDELTRTATAVDLLEEAAIAAHEAFENLDNLYTLMRRMKEDQEAEIITDEDQHPGINKASTWVNPRGDYP